MSRPLRIAFPDAIYHVTTRGVDRRPIYRWNSDRRDFLDVLRAVVERHHWICAAYCLMTNHYHIVVCTPRADLSRGMQLLNGVYAQRFNRRHGRRGHLFEERFNAVLVESDAHLLELCRYVVLNPVRAGICPDPDDWLWSSYSATVGKRPSPAFLGARWLLAHLSHDQRRARAIYRSFVADRLSAAA